MHGQINLNTEQGEFIYNLTRDTSVKNILDIGTWNGLGSTMCVIRGLIDSNKTNFNFISVESNYKQFLSAKANLQDYQKYVNLEYGRLTHDNELINLDDYDDSFFSVYSRDMHRQWYNEDLENYNLAPYVYDNIIQNMDLIDLLILDGGEFSSYQEFCKLQDKFKIIVLDDTNTIKNYQVSEIIRNSKNKYHILYDNKNIKNGFMIATRIF
jgi:hypothetical protein